MSPAFRSVRRILAAGGAVLLLGGAAIGVASAQTAPATPTAQAGQPQAGHQAFIDALARRLGVTSTALQTAISEARTEVGLPAEGGFGFGPHGHGGPGGRGGRLDAAATAIGIPVAQLQQELSGKSLAQVAQAHGKNPTDVANALKAAENTRIDQAVAAGRLTADQANQQKQQVAQRIDQQINQVMPTRPAGAPGA